MVWGKGNQTKVIHEDEKVWCDRCDWSWMPIARVDKDKRNAKCSKCQKGWPKASLRAAREVHDARVKGKTDGGKPKKGKGKGKAPADGDGADKDGKEGDGPACPCWPGPA